MFRKFKLTDKQIRGIANIVAHEQGTKAGRYAEASLIANRAEIYHMGNVERCVTSGWFAYGKSRYRAGTSNKEVIAIVKDVFLNGHRTLPKYVDEHDCMSDIKTVTQNGRNIKWSKAKWKPHKTFIRNRYSAKYWFYTFPGGYKTGVDPFGYNLAYGPSDYGNFHYILGTASADEWGSIMPIIKRGSKGMSVKIWQTMLGIKVTGSFGEKTEKATKEFQKKHNLKQDGVVGGFTWSAAIGELD